ncbi:MAG TPA: thioredoxin-like domain-containing protein [Opitutaceae bacterium]|jgi:nucleoredoxin|nr:thioredoxin-like domain-containing protein [Opitutaceae bacterium]
MKKASQKLIICTVLLWNACLTRAHEWTIDGKTKLEAEFGGSMGDIVFLHKPDGSQVKCALASLSAEDRAFIKECERNNSSVVATVAPAKKPYSPIVNLLWDKLVMPAETGFADYVPTGTPDYIALYFSAGWCGPCHRFTPRLVDFYRQMKPRHDNFEIVFVSDDRNEREMLGYMRELSMPWPALRFAEIKNLQDIRNYAGPGIPCLVVLDARGQVVADSYVNGQYVGPDRPMNYLGKLLESAP